MARLFLIRHGEPSATWGGGDADPGLTELGHSQALAAAERLRLVTPRHIVTSPLRRAQETAAPLAEALAIAPKIAPEVAEIPAPENMGLEHRADWLRTVMAREWNAVEPDLRTWRDSVINYLIGLQADTAVFSHFVAINVALGASIGDDRVVCFKPAHASITVLETTGRVISLVEPGETAETAVR